MNAACDRHGEGDGTCPPSRIYSHALTSSRNLDKQRQAYRREILGRRRERAGNFSREPVQNLGGDQDFAALLRARSERWEQPKLIEPPKVIENPRQLGPEAMRHNPIIRRRGI